MESERKRRLESLGAWKMICIILLFWHHSPIPKPPADLGARTCEYLFVVSGFLVAYNHTNKKGRVIPFEPYSYVKGKICTMWPLHFTVFLLRFLVNFSFPIISDEIVIGIINIFLLQSWFGSEEIFFSYNGVSWFLCSILFCYLLAPLLLKGIKTKRTAFFMFFAAAVLRLIPELLQQYGYDRFASFSVHVFPPIRLLEFCMGISLFRAHESIRDFLEKRGAEKNRVLFSAAETAVVVGTVGLAIMMNDTWIRGNFVLLFCLFVLVFSFDGGLISLLLGGSDTRKNPISRFLGYLGRYEYELFILHQSMIVFAKLLMNTYFTRVSPWITTAAAAVMTFAFAWAWKRYMSARTSKMMRNAFGRAERFIVGGQDEHSA